MKTGTDRAAAAIAAAERVFADEMGAMLGIGPAARAVLIAQVGAAIEAAVADERKRFICAAG